jgi:hypothetical protein
MENNNNLFTFQREYATNKYLEYVKSRGLNDLEYCQQMINLFWLKVDEFPAYNEKCYQEKNKRNYYNSTYDTSNHPDYDYASRYSGISGDYIYSLICVATKIFNDQCKN